MSDPNVPPTDDGVISLKPLLTALWAERRRILIVWALAAAAFVVGAVAYYLMSPSERTAQVEFRLLFDGADRGQYPNGTPFSAADIIAAPVLTQVYERNDLKQYLSYDSLKSGVLVFESSRELDLLNFEYQAKLADSKMLAVDRARVEAEFRQKLEALRVPQLSLQFMASGRAASPPSHLMEKVLNDILAEWAEQAAAQRGAVAHQIEVLTPGVILKDTLNTQTMLIRYDLLRRHVDRVLSQIDRLAGLPGASTARVGPDKVSLMDLRTSLTDLLDFQLNPLIGRRLVSAMKPNEAALNILYLEGRLAELQRLRDTAGDRKLQLEAALRAFTSEAVAPGVQRFTEGTQAGATPQVSDTFLDRLIDIAGRSSAMDYRTTLTNRIIAAGETGLVAGQDIAFYEEILRSVRSSAGSRPGDLKPEEVPAAFEQVQTRVVEILTLSNDAYALISATSLNPRSVLYRVTGPYSVVTARTVTPRYLALTGLVVIVVSGLLITLVVAGATLFRKYRLS